LGRKIHKTRDRKAVVDAARKPTTSLRFGSKFR
jgi:hypothetical protein